MRTVFRTIVSTLCFGLIALVQTAMAGERLTLASGEAATPAYSAGIGLSSLLKFKLQARHKIDVQAVRSPGPVDTVHLLQDGGVDLAILPSVIGHAARAATGPFAGRRPALRLRAITTLWHDALHLVVREEDVATGTVADMLALETQKVFLGKEATGSPAASRLLLSRLGIDLDKPGEGAGVADAVHDNVIGAIKQGAFDALSINAKPPSPIFHDVGDRLNPGNGNDVGDPSTAGLRFLAITADQIARADGGLWLWSPHVIKASTYPGQNEDVPTVAHAQLLVVDADLPDETVYLITKSIFENLAYLHRVAPGLGDLTLDRALAGVSLPLHSGALRYFKEIDLIPGGRRSGAPAGEPRLRRRAPPHPDRTGYPNLDVARQGSIGRGDADVVRHGRQPTRLPSPGPERHQGSSLRPAVFASVGINYEEPNFTSYR